MNTPMIETKTRMALLAELLPDPEQLARHPSAKIEQLAGDMAANGLHQAIGAGEDKRLIYGHGRYAAAKLLGWKEIETKFYLGAITPTQRAIVRATENLLRTDWTGFQKWKLCEELLRLNPSWTQKDLAHALNFDPASISHFLSPSKCIRAVQEALQTGLITIADCAALSRVDEQSQEQLLTVKLNGASAAEVTRQARKARNGHDNAPRVSQLKCQISGACITLAAPGTGLSIEGVVDLLSELLKEARKANASGISAKTWEKSLRDRYRHD